MNWHKKDIIERLEDAAGTWLDRSALFGMSSAALLREAGEEIKRLRNELAKEIYKTHLITASKKKNRHGSNPNSQDTRGPTPRRVHRDRG